MCLAILKPDANGKFTEEDFRTSTMRNADGTGIAYVENGRVIVHKLMGTPREQLELYNAHMHRPQLVIHHRMGTSGEKSTFNVHPFYVTDIDEGDSHDLVMVHNGVISMNNFEVKTDEDKRCSDTQLFVNQYLKPILKQCPNLIDTPAFQKLIHDFIGSSNKLIFLRSDGLTWIFNKPQGAERSGCWLSNTYSTTPNYTLYSAPTFPSRHGTNISNIYDNYDYDDGVYFREPYNRANRIKAKALDTMSQLDADTIIEAIDEYSGMTAKCLEDLVKDEPQLSWDMLNFLSPSEVKVDPKLIDEPCDKLAGMLFDVMQVYTKQKAA